MVIDDGYLLAYKGKNDCIIMTMVNGRHYDSSFLVTYFEDWALGNNTFFQALQINKIYPNICHKNKLIFISTVCIEN